MCYNGGMQRTRKLSWDIALLPELVADSRGWSDVIRGLGLSEKAAGNYRTVQKHAAMLGLDISHFVGKGAGKSKGNVKYTLGEMLVENGSASTYNVRNRILKEGIKAYQCELCGIAEWMGKPIALQLDHINGVGNDHRVENLRILCPNCHSQTETWGSRNVRGTDS